MIYFEIVYVVGLLKVVWVVGMVIGKNFISWIIFCYCVFWKLGGFGGYYWGLLVKCVMLVYEVV